MDGISSDISTGLAKLNAPVFLAQCGNKAGKKVVTIHSSEPRLSHNFVRYTEKALGIDGDSVTLELKRHSMGALMRPKSLEALCSQFGKDEVIYDPTRVISRMNSLVGLAKSIRLALGPKVNLIGFESRRRTLYVILDQKVQDAAVTALQDTMLRVAGVVEKWRNGARPDYDLSIRVGFEAPLASRLVAVDARSVVTSMSRVLSGKLARVARALGLATLFGAGTAVSVQAGPAVSQPNLTVIQKTGATDGDFQGEVYAKGTLPLGDMLGLQLEGGIGNDNYYGVAGHLFTRDPDFGLLGAYASIESIDRYEISRVAAETELYLNSITIGGDVGFQGGEVDHGVFGKVDLKFYATPDFVLSIGGEASPGVKLGKLSAEWRPGLESLPGLSLFADGEFGNHSYDSVRVGMTYHFGSSSSSLIDRDRREDPPIKLKNNAPVQAKKKKDASGTTGYSTSG
jgi:hypothetical protein